MSNIFYSIGDFFGVIFNGIEVIGNSINYIYIGVIFVFLVVWISKMIKHRKDGEEHASL